MAPWLSESFLIDVVLPAYSKDKDGCIYFLCASSIAYTLVSKIYNRFTSKNDCPRVKELPQEEKDALLNSYNEMMIKLSTERPELIHDIDRKRDTIKSIYITGFIAANI